MSTAPGGAGRVPRTAGRFPLPQAGAERARRALQALVRTTSDLVLLNLLWLCCCAGVVTAPAATTALAAVLIDRADGDPHDGSTLRFLIVFRRQFARSLAIAALLAVTASVLVADAVFIASATGFPRWALLTVSLPLALLWALVATTAPLVLAVTRRPLAVTARTVVLFPLQHLPAALAGSAVIGALLVLAPAAPIVVFLLPSSAAYAVVRLHRRGLGHVSEADRGAAVPGPGALP